MMEIILTVPLSFVLDDETATETIHRLAAMELDVDRRLVGVGSHGTIVLAGQQCSWRMDGWNHGFPMFLQAGNRVAIRVLGWQLGKLMAAERERREAQ